MSGEHVHGRGGRAALGLRTTVSAGLLVSAAVHADLAATPFYAAGQLTLGALFAAQAVAAVLAAAGVLARGGRGPLAVAGVVALGSLVAVVLSTYVRLPSVGPFPVLYEPFWYTAKVVAALAATVAAGAVLAALTRARSDRAPDHG